MMKFKFQMLLCMLCLLGFTLNGRAQGLTSGDFESGLQIAPAGWFAFASPNVTLTLVTTGVHGGTNCGKVVVLAGQSGFVQQKVWGPMQVNGQKLTFSGWVKTTWGTGGVRNLRLSEATKIGTGFGTLTETPNTTGELADWTKLSLDFTITDGPSAAAAAGTSSSFLSPRLTIDATGSTTDNIIYMDDFSLVTTVPVELSNFELE